MNIENFVSTAAIYALPVIFAITLHEAAHGYVARHFGDHTAEMEGRISVNPLRHIDPIGTVLVPLVTLFFAGLLFGWAKPVPVNFGNLRRPKKDMLWVAAAGPGANLVMAVFWAMAIKLAIAMPGNYFALPMVEMGKAGVMINTVLMVLNLFPLPPLDGGRIAVSLLPPRLAWRFARIEPYGLFILVFLLASGILGVLLWPAVDGTLHLLSALFDF